MDFTQLRKELPTGSVAQIAKNTGVSVASVWHVLYGKKSPKEAKILKATAEHLAACKKEVKEAREAINAILEPAQ
jgi:hypothetical protein